MVIRKKQIEEEVEKTLQLLDKKGEIEAGPYFYTHLQTKIGNFERKKESPLQKIFIIGWARQAILLILVVLNVLVIVNALRDSDYQSDTRDEYIAALADEYSLDQNDSNLFLMQ